MHYRANLLVHLHLGFRHMQLFCSLRHRSNYIHCYHYVMSRSCGRLGELVTRYEVVVSGCGVRGYDWVGFYEAQVRPI